VNKSRLHHANCGGEAVIHTRKLLNILGIRLSSLSALFFLVLCSSPFATAQAQKKVSAQHFVCNTGYTAEECRIAMDALRKVLVKYPAETLGEWTWVLVRSDDWKRLLRDRGFDPDSPAFSYLPARETFFDGALVVKSSSRGVELSAIWHMPIEDLLELAVRHEIAHAMCNERDELKANAAALGLKEGKPAACQPSLVANNRTDQRREGE
jgi:hypothetical protein